MNKKLNPNDRPDKKSTQTMMKRLVAGFVCWSMMSTAFAQTSAISQMQGAGNPSVQNLSQEQLTALQARGYSPEQINMMRANGGLSSQPQFPGAYVQQRPMLPSAPAKPTEFEVYVSGMTGEQLNRFGSDLIRDGEQTFSPSSTAAVPNDYIIAAGDELFVRVWGSIDADLRLVVDRQGQIVIPRVGAVQVAGVTYGNVGKTIQNAISKTYSGVSVAASIGQMRGIRVYVTGYAQIPGAYTVNNLSSLVNVVMAAGGPSAAGSYRDIQLKRGGKVISTFDLYDLLLKGDKSADRAVTAEDVIHVGPAGAQIAMVGAVNKPSIFEIKPGENVQQVLNYAGGFISGAKTESINFMSLDTRSEGFKTIDKTAFSSKTVTDGDIYMATSGVAMRQPIDKQMRMIKVDGQVNKPGVYVLKAGSTLVDAIAAAGGFSTGAYLYGTKLERVTVRTVQEENLKRFIREFKRDVQGASALKVTNAEDAALTKAREEQGKTLLKSLEEIKPDGRMALSMKPDAKKLPEILVESGDVLTVPPVPYSVTVLGSINGGQVGMAFKSNNSAEDYIKLAGGFSRGADRNNVYVMRASGEFVSASGWFRGIGSVEVMPGDAIFVPEDLQKTSFTKELKDWTSIIYQLGLGAAAIKVLQD
jgi:protein involved in polysaccharide export with SLBB domain